MHEISIVAEEIFHIGSWPVTNSLFLAGIAVLTLTVFALAIRRKLSLVPGKLQGFFELAVEELLSLMDSVLGDRHLSEKYLPIIRELAVGYVDAAREANVAIINGEIAQMGTLVSGWGEFPYHWGAACVWVARKEKLFTGAEIKKGDAVVVLRENGFRANGWSLVRSVFQKAHGEEWHNFKHGASTLGLLALTPSTIYSRFVVGLHGGFESEGACDIHGVAHITGGGIPEKLMRVLRRSGLGANLPNLFEPPEIVSHCQKLGSISDRDAYRAWNMGQGMMLITPEPDKVLAEAKAYGMEAQIAGEITGEPNITITSKGVESTGQRIVFDVQ